MTNIIDKEIMAIRHVGRVEMLDSVVASLREYPNGGGDIRVMKEVERIMKKYYFRVDPNTGEDILVNAQTNEDIKRGI